MRFRECSEFYTRFSSKASDVARQLAFAGIGIVWVFRSTKDGSVPTGLLLPLALFSVTLGLDLLQYISASIMWGRLKRTWKKKWFKEKEELGIESDRDYFLPRLHLLPQTIFFVLKQATILLAYILTASFVWSEWYKT